MRGDDREWDGVESDPDFFRKVPLWFKIAVISTLLLGMIGLVLAVTVIVRVILGEL
jgi:hypothetical protein